MLNLVPFTGPRQENGRRQSALIINVYLLTPPNVKAEQQDIACVLESKRRWNIWV